MTVALGTAPIPGSSLFLVAGILASIGIPPGQAALIVAFFLPFDRPLDMIHTVPNMTSDLAVAPAVATVGAQHQSATRRRLPVRIWHTVVPGTLYGGRQHRGDEIRKRVKGLLALAGVQGQSPLRLVRGGVWADQGTAGNEAAESV